MADLPLIAPCPDLQEVYNKVNELKRIKIYRQSSYTVEPERVIVHAPTQ